MKIQLLKFSFILSILVHIGFFGGLYLSKKLSSENINNKESIEVIILDSAAKKKMQIVEQSDKALNQDISKDARFLSKNNQRVVEETKATRSGDFNNNAGQNGSAVKLGGAKKKPKPMFKTLPNLKTKSGLPTLHALKPKFDWQKVKEVNKQAESARRGPASANNDYLKGVKEGRQTLLNTREFVYYSYYNRIRKKIRQYWEPSIKDKVRALFKQGRKIASDKNKITKVLITLNQQGTLVKVQVVEDSGIRDLDDAAVDAFRDAAPFPNPPKGLVEMDGTVKIRWDFVLEV